MRRDVLVGVAVLLLVGGSIAYYAYTRPAGTPAPGPASGTATTTGEAATIEEHAEYYDITAHYPRYTALPESVSASADAAAVALMKQFIDDTIGQFKKDGNFDNLTAADKTVLAGRTETLQISYLRGSSPQTISYIFTIYVDTGGAHGNTLFKTFVFDTKSGKSLALADVFKPGSDYLAALSSISRAKLPAILGDAAVTSMINDGTMPDEKNFENFFFDNNNFGLLFPPYQVAPYAAGPQTLYIPASELSSLLRSNYP